MASHRFTQLQQQFLFVPGQVAGECQRIGGMVGAEDERLRRVEAADQSFLFLQYRQVVRHLEWLAVFAAEFFLDAFVQIQLQCGKVGDGRAVEQGDGAVDMLVAVLAAAQPEDDGGGDFHAARLCLVQHFGHAPLCGALGDLFQDEVGAGFDAEVEQVQLVLVQQGQFCGTLALEVAGCGVAGDARQPRQRGCQFAQDGEQVWSWESQRIAIGEEHAVRIRPAGGGLADIDEHVVERALGVLLAAIHRAEAALVEAAPQRGLDNQIVALGGRAIQRHVVEQVHAEL